MLISPLNKDPMYILIAHILLEQSLIRFVKFSFQNEQSPVLPHSVAVVNPDFSIDSLQSFIVIDSDPFGNAPRIKNLLQF